MNSKLTRIKKKIQDNSGSIILGLSISYTALSVLYTISLNKQRAMVNASWSGDLTDEQREYAQKENSRASVTFNNNGIPTLLIYTQD